MDKVEVTELGYVGVGADDLEAWHKFASEIMGLEWLDEGEGDRVYLRMDYWHHRIVLHSGAGDDLLYAGFRVAGPDELKNFRNQLEDAGIAYEAGTPELAKERRVLDLLVLTDPAGIRIEVFHGPQVDRAKPMRPGRGMHGPFVTEGDGFGHIVVKDGGIDESYRFYTEVLGLKGSIEAQIPLPDGNIQSPVFLHCNRRDHTLAFGAGPMRRKLHHIMVETSNQDDVGLAYDLVKKADIPLLMTLGKHSNDNMLSFYCQTPSGWFWEFGAGATKANAQSEYCTSDSWGHELVGMPLLMDL